MKHVETFFDALVKTASKEKAEAHRKKSLKWLYGSAAGSVGASAAGQYAASKGSLRGALAGTGASVGSSILGHIMAVKHQRKALKELYGDDWKKKSKGTKGSFAARHPFIGAPMISGHRMRHQTKK